MLGADQLTDRRSWPLLEAADTDGAEGVGGGSLTSVTVTVTAHVADLLGEPLSVAVTVTVTW